MKLQQVLFLLAVVLGAAIQAQASPPNLFIATVNDSMQSASGGQGLESKRVAQQSQPTPHTQDRVAPLNPHESEIVGKWKHEVAEIIERKKEYPEIARLQGAHGLVRVTFVIDRLGQLLSASVSLSSGFDVLDREALYLVAGAEPYPPPPEEVRGDKITIVVP